MAADCADPDDDLQAVHDYLLEVGVPPDRLRAAIERGEPQAALIEYRLVDRGDRHPMEAVAAEAGLSPAAIVEVVRALGLAVPAPGQATLSAVEMHAVQLTRWSRCSARRRCCGSPQR